MSQQPHPYTLPFEEFQAYLDKAAAARAASPPMPVIRPAPLPYDQWPQWAKDVAEHRTEGDRGVGSTVEHQIGLYGGEAFKAWYAGLGLPAPAPTCASPWNLRYPYSALTAV